MTEPSPPVTAPAAHHMSTAEAVVETLLLYGIDQVFALPGLHNDPLFDAFYQAQDRLRVLHPRHEQTAAYMALGAALATGKPWPFAVVPGPGFLNATAALLTAYAMNAPVLGLLGQIPQADIDRGHGHLHELHDQLGMAAHVAKFTARITGPHEAATLTKAALTAAISGRPRPAVLECAMDVWPKRAPVILGAVAQAETLALDDEALDRAAALLAGAKRPLIVVGGGAIGAGIAIAAIAEHLQAPIASYRRGRGVVPTTHPLAVPVSVGHRLWRQADVVLAIGTRLFTQQGSWGVDDELKVVRIDIDALEPDRFRRATVPVVGDAAACAPALLARLLATPAHVSRAAEVAGHMAWMHTELAKLEPQMSYLGAIRAALPEDGIFVDEVTQVGFASRLGFPVTKDRTFLSPGYQDNLGWGYGTALGAQAVRPEVPVVSIAGDGGFLYQIGELATAVQHRLPVVVVVFDNNAFFNVKRIQALQYGNRQIACDLHNPDFAKLAETFGVASFRVSDAAGLERAVGDAIALRAPALVHVKCGAMPSPWHLLQMPRVRG